MNKILLITISFFISILAMNAQDERYGIRVGANFSSISSDIIVDELDKGRISVAVGFFAEYPITSKLSIQPELQYSGQGNKDKDLRINYLQLPVLFKYNFSDIVNVQLGPQAGLKIWEWEDNQENIPDFATFDFALIAGIGVNITDNFFADLRYAFGLSNVFDKNGSSSVSIDNLKGSSQNIQIAVGYRL